MQFAMSQKMCVADWNATCVMAFGQGCEVADGRMDGLIKTIERNVKLVWAEWDGLGNSHLMSGIRRTSKKEKP